MSNLTRIIRDMFRNINNTRFSSDDLTKTILLNLPSRKEFVMCTYIQTYGNKEDLVKILKKSKNALENKGCYVRIRYMTDSQYYEITTYSVEYSFVEYCRDFEKKGIFGYIRRLDLCKEFRYSDYDYLRLEKEALREKSLTMSFDEVLDTGDNRLIKIKSMELAEEYIQNKGKKKDLDIVSENKMPNKVPNSEKNHCYNPLDGNYQILLSGLIKTQEDLNKVLSYLERISNFRGLDIYGIFRKKLLLLKWKTHSRKNT